LIVVVVGVIVISGALFYMTRGLAIGENLVISEINLTELEEGNYQGKYEDGRWSNEVEVEVINNKINNIKIVDDIMITQPEVREKIFKSVIEKQNLDVDIISEATVTTKAYLKSIELALKK